MREHDGVRREELWRLDDSDFLRDRPKRGAECIDRMFGLEHVEDAETIRGLARRVKQEPIER